MTQRNLLRGAIIIVALGLIGLWISFARALFASTQFMPAPGGVMLPILFCVFALGAALAAWRGEGVSVALAGGLSLVPMGIVLLFFPGPARVVPLFDLTLIVLGVALMRNDPTNLDRFPMQSSPPRSGPTRSERRPHGSAKHARPSRPPSPGVRNERLDRMASPLQR
jgi:hypothetical protein